MSGSRKVDDEERAAFKTALLRFHSGISPIRKAFRQVEPGLIDGYYRRKKELPDKIARIDAKARAAAPNARITSKI